ncbi:MAG: flagellar export protein FliJ [Porticoccaceae bacterium]|nr:flagellar export protein FliJ [Pseudomonadales bacterium]MCP5173030.1 flagellar export protein FliJ [Pseudomonadales bacterium]MCP5302504.1 flagellar export protein FliJ [Pseudomonadales bacterium]
MDGGKIGKAATYAKTVEQKSARELQLNQQGHLQKQQQLDQLLQFKQEYEDRLGSMGQHGIAARQLQDYRLFLSKLNQAISQQLQDVQKAEENLEEAREQWKEEAKRTSAFDHLVEQHRRLQIEAQNKAEQKTADEETLARQLHS